MRFRGGAAREAPGGGAWAGGPDWAVRGRRSVEAAAGGRGFGSPSLLPPPGSREGSRLGVESEAGFQTALPASWFSALAAGEERLASPPSPPLAAGDRGRLGEGEQLPAAQVEEDCPGCT